MGQSRSEDILENILGDDNDLTSAQSRLEDLLLQLLEQGASGSGGGGMTLYGPYIAYNSQAYTITQTPGNVTSIYLDYLVDDNGNVIDLNDFTFPEGAFFIPVGFYPMLGSAAHYDCITTPYLSYLTGDPEYEMGSYQIINDAAFTIEEYQMSIQFLSTVELPLAQTEGE